MKNIFLAAVVGLVGYFAYKEGFMKGRVYQAKIGKDN